MTLDAHPASEAGRKTVLIVAPDFTPSSYPPALRARFFAQHLPEFGWDPIVLATEPRFYEWNVDPENQKLLDPELEVIRTPALSVKWTRKLGVGDLGIRSLWHHWRALNRICRKRRIDLILISVPPNIQIVLGRLAHERFGIPYILDYNDPIITDYYRKLPKAQRPPKWWLVDRMYRVVEPFALRRVNQLVGVDRSYMAGLFTTYDWLRGTAATPVAFGVEPADFEFVRRHPRPNRIFDKQDGLLHLTHVGSGGPGMTAGLRALFRALGLLRQRAPELISRMRMHFVGTTYAVSARAQVLPVALEMGVYDLVDEHPGRVHHLDAIQILLDSHALVIVGSDAPHYTASKIFPYILAAKPLLTLFHEQSAAVQLLRETAAGAPITFSGTRPPLVMVDEIAAALSHILTLPPTWCPQTRWDKFEPYTARAVTARLAEVFDAAVRPSRSPGFADGSAGTPRASTEVR